MIAERLVLRLSSAFQRRQNTRICSSSFPPHCSPRALFNAAFYWHDVTIESRFSTFPLKANGEKPVKRVESRRYQGGRYG